MLRLILSANEVIDTKKYTKPNVEFTTFSVEDIITQSGLIVSADSLSGASAEMYQVYTNNSAAKNTNISVFT